MFAVRAPLGAVRVPDVDGPTSKPVRPDLAGQAGEELYQLLHVTVGLWPIMEISGDDFELKLLCRLHHGFQGVRSRH